LEEKAPGAVPNRMLAVAKTMIESFMLILELWQGRVVLNHRVELG
jgi:hypothetical protein